MATIVSAPSDPTPSVSGAVIVGTIRVTAITYLDYQLPNGTRGRVTSKADLPVGAIVEQIVTI